MSNETNPPATSTTNESSTGFWDYLGKSLVDVGRSAGMAWVDTINGDNKAVAVTGEQESFIASTVSTQKIMAGALILSSVLVVGILLARS